MPSELTYHGYHALDSQILGFTLWAAGHSVDTEKFPDFAATFHQGSFVSMLTHTLSSTSNSTSRRPATRVRVSSNSVSI